MTVDPFIKWAGGKRRMVEMLRPLILSRLSPGGSYWEPFLGGGAVALSMPRDVPVNVSDVCEELVTAWDEVRRRAGQVSKWLEYHRVRHSKDHYYEVRATVPRDASERAARFIYLNKTGFNGLYRKNKSGGFNVPFGRGRSSSIPTYGALRKIAAVASSWRLEYMDFEEMLENPTWGATAGDVVFADPPYDETQGYSSGFSASDQARLAACLRRCARRGVGVVTTNADTPRIRRLYSWASVTSIDERRMISCDAANRGDASCVLAVRP